MDILNVKVNSGASSQITDSINAANFAGKIPELPHNIVSSCAYSNSCKQLDDSPMLWIIDSGASNHMCHNAQMFITLTNFPKPFPITLPNGKTISVVQFGDVKIADNITLKNVLHVPVFHYSLLSIGKLTKQLHCGVIFTSDHCILQGPFLKRPLVIGKAHKGLYLLHLPSKAALSCSSTSHACLGNVQLGCNPFSFSSQNDVLSDNSCNISCGSASGSMKIWHHRLGHMPLSKMKQLKFLHDSINTFNSSFICDVCPQARQHRLPFPHSQINTNSIFELIHVDIWGPYHTLTHQGYRYFLTIVDDYSRAT